MGLTEVEESTGVLLALAAVSAVQHRTGFNYFDRFVVTP
jgi:hypothetical protein